MKYIIQVFLFIFFCIGLCSCDKETFFEGPDFFEDDFESYSTIDDLLVESNEFWSFTQLTREENIITVDTSKFYSGNSSLKFQALKTTDGNASKCSIAKQNMAFWEGETVRLSAWYFIEDTETLEWLFLMDLEEQVAVGAGPGMRIALVNNQLRVEYKFYESDVKQIEGNEVDFPRNEWVEIVWEAKLSTNNEGTIKLWQNDELIIESNEIRTLPKDFLYFQQGTKGMYSSVELGITANSQDNDLTMWVDDVKMERIE